MTSSSEPVFISIASYRDLQLVPTVEDCLKKALHPHRLRFGICWQHGDEKLPETWWSDPRMQIVDVEWRRSQGACWARAEVMKLWRGEPWYMQVDSHCRFKPGWDQMLISLMEFSDQPKTVLSTYATPFVPGAEEHLQEAPMQIALQGFTPEGIPHMKPLSMSKCETPRLLRARFLSAGFLFAPGSFVVDVPYDPQLYFLGEEISMTLRAYTEGYDLYHPQETIVWHDYVRAGATKHWCDHVEGETTIRTWGQQDLLSKERVRRLLAGEHLDKFNLGDFRSLGDYESYAGICLARRRAQDYTMRACEPPNPNLPIDWPDHVYNWMVRIELRNEDLSPAMQEAAFWYIGVHDELGNEIYRRDLLPDEIQSLFQGSREVILVCECLSGSIPFGWTVWPVSREHQWMRKLIGVFAPADFSVVLED